MALCLDTLPVEVKVLILDRVAPEEIRKITHLNQTWRHLVQKNRHRLRRIYAEEIRFYDIGDGNVQINMVMQGNPTWTKEVTSRTLPASHVFDFLWPFITKELHVNAYSDVLRDVFAQFEDYWFEAVEVLGVFENCCDVAALSLISRCPRIRSIFIDPCFTIGNVREIVKHMRSVQDIKLLCSDKDIIVDDTTLLSVIEKSNNSENGLRTFWVDTICTEFSMAMVKRFLLESKFGHRVSILLERVNGRRYDFEQFVENNFQFSRHSGNSFQFQNAFGAELNVMISRFENEDHQ